MGEVAKGRIEYSADAGPAIAELKNFGKEAKGAMSGFDMGDPLGSATQGLAGMAKTLGPAGVAVGVLATGVVAVGTALYKLGEEFDAVFTDIKNKTGKTGVELDKLKTSFKNVLASGPEAMADLEPVFTRIAGSIALTGKPLETLVRQIADSARIMKFDGAEGADVFADALKRFKTPAGGASKALDTIFKSAQTFNVPMGELLGHVQSAAPFFSQMGFDIENTGAIMGKLAGSGFSAETALRGVKTGIQNLAKVGKSADDLPGIAGKIASLEDPAQATALSVQTFGKKVGVEMAAMLRSGGLELDDITHKIGEIDGAITTASDQSKTWGDLVKQFGNMAKVHLEPIASKVFPMLGEALKKYGPGLMEWLGKAIEWLIKAGPYFKDFLELAIKPTIFFWKVLVEGIKVVWGWLNTMRSAWDAVWKAIKPVVDAIMKLIDAFAKLKLPKWLLPGSPTPLEVGLWGIARAAQEVNRQLSMMAQITAPGLSPLALGAFAGGQAAAAAVSMPVSIYNNVPGASVGVSPASGGGLVATIRARGTMGL